MAGLADALLAENGSRSKASSRLRWQNMVVGLCILSAGAGCVLSRLGYVAKLQHYAVALYEGELPETDAQGDDRHWLQCVLDTGGTCSFSGCNAERGPAECRHSAWRYRCMCKPGTCSNIAGRCEEQANEVVAESVRLYNAQWPTYCLYMTWGTVLAVTEDCHDDSSKWNLLELPASVDGGSAFERKHFMLGNVKYPSYVAETETLQECRQRNHGDCWDRYVPTANKVHTMQQAHVLNLRPAEWEETAFMIQSSTNMGRYWDVSKFSWSLSTVPVHDPGPQGYWKFDPPLDIPGSDGGNGGKLSR